MFALCWNQHGGSGLSITWHEAGELEFQEAMILARKIRKQRKAEQAALNKAAKSARARGRRR